MGFLDQMFSSNREEKHKEEKVKQAIDKAKAAEIRLKKMARGYEAQGLSLKEVRHHSSQPTAN